MSKSDTHTFMFCLAVAFVCIIAALVFGFRSVKQDLSALKDQSTSISTDVGHLRFELQELESNIDKHIDVAFSKVPVPVTVVMHPAPVEKIEPDPTPMPVERPASVVKKPMSSFRSVIVRPGDTLWSIAERELGTPYAWLRLARLNAILDPNRLEVGDTIIISK